MRVCVAMGKRARDAYRIRYVAYRAEGYIPESPTGEYVDRFDDLDVVTTFLAIRSGVPFGTLRLVYDSPELGVPMDKEGFAEAIRPLRERGRRLAEVCRLAFLPDYWSVSGGALLLLQRAMLWCAYGRGVTDLVITVNPRDVPLYERKLLFERLSGERPYESLIGAPGIALRLDIENLAERYQEKYAGRTFDLHAHFFGNGMRTRARPALEVA